MGHQIIICSLCGVAVMEGSNAWECDCGAKCSVDTGYKWHNTIAGAADAPASERSDLLACKNKCAVTDSDGNHCPETPMTSLIVNGKELMLCYRCFLNISNGMYGIMNIS